MVEELRKVGERYFLLYSSIIVYNHHGENKEKDDRNSSKENFLRIYLTQHSIFYQLSVSGSFFSISPLGLDTNSVNYQRFDQTEINVLFD